jgi:hypothetical protein
MIDRADQHVKEWIESAVGVAPVFAPPGAGPLPDGVGVYLLGLEDAPPARSPRRPPLQLALRYLVTTENDDVHDAHALLGKLAFKAMEGIDPVEHEDDEGRLTLHLTLDLAGIPEGLWQDLGVPVRPALLLRALLRYERRPAAVRPVLHPAVVQASPLTTLEGRVVTEIEEGDWPLVGAEVQIPRWNLSTRTDRRGAFRFRGVPADPGDGECRLVVRSRDQEHEVSIAKPSRAGDDGGLLIRFPRTED